MEEIIVRILETRIPNKIRKLGVESNIISRIGQIRQFHTKMKEVHYKEQKIQQKIVQ